MQSRNASVLLALLSHPLCNAHSIACVTSCVACGVVAMYLFASSSTTATGGLITAVACAVHFVGTLAMIALYFSDSRHPLFPLHLAILLLVSTAGVCTYAGEAGAAEWCCVVFLPIARAPPGRAVQPMSALSALLALAVPFLCLGQLGGYAQSLGNDSVIAALCWRFAPLLAVAVQALNSQLPLAEQQLSAIPYLSVISNNLSVGPGGKPALPAPLDLSKTDSVQLPARQSSGPHQSPQALVPEPPFPRENALLYAGRPNGFQHFQQISPSRRKRATQRPLRYKKANGSLLGRGGAAEVYLGMNVDSGELIAVKQVLRSQFTESQVRELEQEVSLLRSLAHRHIVKYIGTDRSNPACFTVLLEFVPGGSVASLLSKFGPFCESVIRHYMEQTLSGLQYLHKMGIIHGDIKGGNLLLAEDGTIKLADFGMAHLLFKTGVNTQEVFGTILWMAPEITRQEAATVKADIWSLGCTVIEMATAKLPWHERHFDNPNQAFLAIATCTEPPKCTAAITPKLQSLLDICLRLEPGQRHSCDQLLRNPFFSDNQSSFSFGTTAIPVRGHEGDAVSTAVMAKIMRGGLGAGGGTGAVDEDLTRHQTFARESSHDFIRLANFNYSSADMTEAEVIQAEQGDSEPPPPFPYPAHGQSVISASLDIDVFDYDAEPTVSRSGTGTFRSGFLRRHRSSKKTVVPRMGTSRSMRLPNTTELEPQTSLVLEDEEHPHHASSGSISS
eukprot:TRINITY_DN5750_c0_g1_i1.p1 TRINITY_DN5750_c0_g1~~TRINITY_DN5750_c0_g1_i1.p1  ORF type:complete len:730 (+),score=80.00 TRINITY_DN5750_c0_g1_i1:41-2230(+)